MRWTALLLFSLVLPGVAAAQPSLIPPVDAMQPAKGKPYLSYRLLIAAPPAGLSDWHQQVNRLSDDMGVEFRALETSRQAASKASEALRPFEMRRIADAERPEYDRQTQIVRDYLEKESAFWGSYRAREDQLLNPLVPALLADVAKFAGERGIEPQLPVVPARYEQAVAGMKDLTAEFIAWRARMLR